MRLSVAGTAAGFVALSKPELELAALGAAGAWCVSRRLSLRSIGVLAAPAIAVPAFVYGAFLTQVSLHALVFDNLYPSRVLQAGGERLLRLHAPLTASSLVHHAEHVVPGLLVGHYIIREHAPIPANMLRRARQLPAIVAQPRPRVADAQKTIAAGARSRC